ncbi:hypothetical protein [Alicyclobacillus mengziensis]|uniref:Uncharacterized protein n=1 Tax=Alicyclobacillus mengziensis TaxID=2931921 RepID=A0A9X7W0N8_9BACL|nr:hypothetical protein [Alicyclobacillus mengziensis]QSO48546.1 hypothetical protein JZ786_06060 [Alicyclobacillus mengziensis]
MSVIRYWFRLGGIVLQYKIKASSPLQPWGALCGSMAALSTVLPYSYRGIGLVLSMSLLVGLLVLMVYVFRKHRDLSFTDYALTFYKHMITVAEIKYIFVPDKPSLIIVRRHNRRPDVTIAFDRNIAGEFLSELRTWGGKTKSN